MRCGYWVEDENGRTSCSVCGERAYFSVGRVEDAKSGDIIPLLFKENHRITSITFERNSRTVYVGTKSKFCQNCGAMMNVDGQMEEDCEVF